MCRDGVYLIGILIEAINKKAFNLDYITWFLRRYLPTEGAITPRVSHAISQKMIYLL